MFTTIGVNIATGIVIALITSWLIWRKREKLKLSYTLTESEFFPFHDGQGKYYAIKISNNGLKLIKNVTANITIHNGGVDKVTNHELMQNLAIDSNNVKFTLDTLNPNEDVNFVITSIVGATPTPIIKIRGEGATADARSSSPSKRDITGTAVIWSVIGFFGAIVYANIMADSKPIDNRMDNVFSSLNKAGLPHVFHKLVENHNDISYEGTSFYLMSSYLKDKTNRKKYIQALSNIAECPNIAVNSKGVAYYMIYKIDNDAKDLMGAQNYLDKCKNECPDIHKYLIEQDKFYNIDSLQKNLR